MVIHIFSIGCNKDLLFKAVNADDVSSIGLSLTEEKDIKISERMIGDFVLQKSMNAETHVELFCPADAKEFADLEKESKPIGHARIVLLQVDDESSKEFALTHNIAVIEVNPPFEGHHSIGLLGAIKKAYDAYCEKNKLRFNLFRPISPANDTEIIAKSLEV